jgi:CCR4-NOT complex subunit CAF16
VTYLGTEWISNTVVKQDIPVARLLRSQGAERYPERTAELLEILDVDPGWKMHEVSDGQRRRVQIVLGLLMPWEVLLLDEVTVDLDVVVRANLLNFLVKETESRNATIVYATHIFDGLASWPTHLVHMSDGTILHTRACNDFPELEEARTRHSDNSPLLRVVESWLRQDLKKRQPAEPQKTRWEVLSENMQAYGDKYYNYWN